MSILKAFSSKITTLNHTVSDYDPPALLKYSAAVQAYTKFELPDHLQERTGGYTDALEMINMYTVRKYDDRYVLNENLCMEHEVIIDKLVVYSKTKDMKGKVEKNCILLHKIHSN